MVDRVVIRVQDGKRITGIASIVIAPGETALTRQIAEAEPVKFGVPAWMPGATYRAGDVVTHLGKLWRCLVNNDAVAADWSPGTAWSLWAETWESGVIPEWRQPQGAHDAYPKDFKVTHRGYTWQSLISANVWEPGSAGAETLWKCLDCPVLSCPEWIQPTGAHDAYNIGDCVTFKGNLYESMINANVWSPAVYAAGWKLLGPA